MIVSGNHKYIYIAVPKTGTTTVEKYLLKIDVSAKRGGIEIDKIFFRLKGHDTAIRAAKVLKENINNFKLFGFVRHPLSRMVSSYNFYKKGGKKENLTKNVPKRYLHRFQVLFARVVPFWIWIFVYPYKSNVEYFIDNRNKIIVDFIGVYERLNDDLEYFFKSLNLDFSFDQLPHLNASNGQEYKYLKSNKLIIALLKLRHPLLRKDLPFYELVCAGKARKGIILS